MTLRQIISAEGLYQELPKERLEKMVRKLSPNSHLVWGKSPRRVVVKGPNGEGEIFVGSNDGRLRVKTPAGIEEVGALETAIEEVLDMVDHRYSQKRFRDRADVAAEGEND